MPLEKFTLEFRESYNRWQLKKDGSAQVIKSFNRKSAATVSGALKKAIGKEGGSVKIQKKDGKFEEERTYPRKAG